MFRSWLTMQTSMMLAVAVATPGIAQTNPPSPADQAEATLVRASQMQALGERCKWISPIEATVLRAVIGEAHAGLPGERLLAAAMKRDAGVAGMANFPCTGPQADSAKAEIQRELIAPGHLWAARARALAELEAKTYPFLSGMKGGSIAPLAASIGIAASSFDNSYSAQAASIRQQAASEMDAAARLACPKIGGKNCPAPPAVASADYGAILLGLVREFGASVHMLVGQAQPKPPSAPTAAATAPPPPAEALEKPSNPRDFFRFAQIGDIGFGASCALGQYVAYLPASQVGGLPPNSTVNAPIFKFGGKQKKGQVVTLYLGGSDWMITKVDGDALTYVGTANVLKQCGY